MKKIKDGRKCIYRSKKKAEEGQRYMYVNLIENLAKLRVYQAEKNVRLITKGGRLSATNI